MHIVILVDYTNIYKEKIMFERKKPLIVKDMVDQKLLKFLHKLNTNKLPAYFNSYKPYL